MATIHLLVTEPVIAQVSAGQDFQRQIAIRRPSEEIAEEIATATAQRRILLELGGVLLFEVGDSGAIWRSHNAEAAVDFDLLFDLLARRPGVEMRFECRIVLP